jgi:uncharacterized membrane protein
MVVAAVALIGVFVAAYLLLYKLGALGTLACGVDGGCEVVQASRYAYLLGVPVAAWGVLGYVLILGLALAGAQPRFADRTWVSVGLLALTGAALAFTVYLTFLEAFVIHAWCRWCIVSGVLAVLVFAFSIPEARRLRTPPSA